MSSAATSCLAPRVRWSSRRSRVLRCYSCSAAGSASLQSGVSRAPNQGGEEKQRMTDNEELHVVFGTGAMGMSVMDALVKRGRRVRMVNRSGRASVPEGVEVLGGDATDEVVARERSAERRVGKRG